MKTLVTACALAAVMGIAPALAADNSSTNQSNSNLPNSTTSSGPGVKGAPGNKNGPAMTPNGTSGNSGASTGEQGMSPSQDATGVKGAPGNKNGPSAKQPGDTMGK